MRTILISNGQNKILDIKHHTSLKNVFQKTMVFSSLTRLNFYNSSPILTYCVGIKRFINFIIDSKQNGNIYLVFL